MPKAKVTYFDLTGLGEPIRFLLTYGGADFEDFRVERSKWPAMKPNTPYAQVPLYEEDGKLAPQSLAICRYLGKKYNLLGDTDWDNILIDSVADAINDLRLKIAPYHYQEDPVVKEALRGPLFEETIPFYLNRFDGTAKENNGHLGCKRLTWVDLYFSGILGYLSMMAGTDLTAKHPNLRAVRDNVYGIPSIKAYLETHPQQ